MDISSRVVAWQKKHSISRVYLYVFEEVHFFYRIVDVLQKKKFIQAQDQEQVKFGILRKLCYKISIYDNWQNQKMYVNKKVHLLPRVL